MNTTIVLLEEVGHRKEEDRDSHDERHVGGKGVVCSRISHHQLLWWMWWQL